MQPSSITFTNKSRNASTYLWTFGDGSTSIEKNPVHIYQNYGNYAVTLKATTLSLENVSSKVIKIKSTQILLLSRNWKATSVKNDGVDQAGYTNFVLTLSGTVGATTFGYTTTGRPTLSAWPSSGNWTFDSDPLITMIRDDGTVDELNITYVVTNTTLQMTFNFQGTGYSGRVHGVKGQWVMLFGL